VHHVARLLLSNIERCVKRRIEIAKTKGWYRKKVWRRIWREAISDDD
jgi:hypothetical protein